MLKKLVSGGLAAQTYGIESFQASCISRFFDPLIAIKSEPILSSVRSFGAANMASGTAMLANPSNHQCNRFNIMRSLTEFGVLIDAFLSCCRSISDVSRLSLGVWRICRILQLSSSCQLRLCKCSHKVSHRSNVQRRS